MNKTLTAMVFTCSFTTLAFADPQTPDKSTAKRLDEPMKLSVFTSAGFLSTSGGSGGGALATGVRYMVGDHFALGLDLGYGLMAVGPNMQDRWWVIPSMAVVLPTHVGKVPLSFDIGVGMGAGTSSGYASWSTYAARPFSADWAFQVEPAVRAHAIAAITVSRSLDVFVRADAAAMILPQGSAPNDGEAMWMMFALGTRFRLL